MDIKTIIHKNISTIKRLVFEREVRHVLNMLFFGACSDPNSPYEDAYENQQGDDGIDFYATDARHVMFDKFKHSF